jgi:hypothetical protein
MSRRGRTAAALALAALALAAAVLSGCGPTPPQAPFRQAQKLDSALSGIASACGLSYQTTALAGSSRPDLSSLQSAANKEVHKLASVYALSPEWIYQGETVRTIVRDSITALGDCGLSDAQARLVRAQAARMRRPPR